MSHEHDDAHDHDVHQHADNATADSATADNSTADNSTADNASAARQYFRSLDNLENTPEFQEMQNREFPEGASEWNDEFSRRKFLGLVAASVALAGLQSCRKPYRKILPFAAKPEGYQPGIPQYYASAYLAGGYAIGTVVRSNDGRPTKIEGNRAHPGSLGAANQYMQADVLGLYDPSRSKHAMKRGGFPAAEGAAELHGDEIAQATVKNAKAAWTAFEAWFSPLCKSLRDKQGEGLRFLVEPSTSPTLLGLIEKKAKQILPKAAFHGFAPINRDQEIAGAKIAFGSALDAHYLLDAADCVMAFDADFLGLENNALATARRYSKKRKITENNQSVSRLYVAEASYTVTGASADHRFRLPAHQIADAALALAAEILITQSQSYEGLTDDLKTALQAHKEHAFKTSSGKNWIAAVAKDLISSKGKSCVMVGARQPAVVHAAVHALNKALGNQGKTVVYTQTDPAMASEQSKSLRDLVADIDAGKVDTLFCLGTNPVYNAPAELDFGDKLAKVKNKIHLGLHFDETAAACDWHLNQAHDLETWGDARAYDGTLSVIQPLIAPLYDGLSVIETLARVLGIERKTGYELVRDEWLPNTKQGDFEAIWSKTLREGLLAGSAAKIIDAAAVSAAEIAKTVSAHQKSSAPSRDAFEITFHQDARLYDGRFANNAWLMELPDPLSKLTWDNAALMSRKTADALGVKNEDVVRITVNGRSLDLPAFVLPGQPEFSIALMLGYGREFSELDSTEERTKHNIARGAGKNTYRLRTSNAMHMAKGAKVEKTGEKYQLAFTQDHGAIEGRPLLREGTLAQFKSDADFAYMMSPGAQKAKVMNLMEKAHAAGGHEEHGGTKPHVEHTEASLNESLWKGRDFVKESPDYQWAMVIDLNSCTGCNACVVACQSENNIPTVGKAQVRRNREMHWIRIDRYFGGMQGEADLSGEFNGVSRLEDPAVFHQPVPCMQCENAPCESVCPVNATTHTPEGLNDMTYNRCVGTRYCSNNCPYKVRRFNFLGYTNRYAESEKMVFNPDVTVRARGVMEKCTYCTQRISHGRQAAKMDGRLVKDGEITPACAQTCPTEAITFGNLMEKAGDKWKEDSRVNKLRKSKLHYAMLGDINTLPRTTYLAKIRNPNPELV